MNGHKLTTNIWIGLESARIRCYTDIMDGHAVDETRHTYDLCGEIMMSGRVSDDHITAVRRILYDEINLTKSQLQAITEPCPTLRKFLLSTIHYYQQGLDDLDAMTRGGDQS